MNDENPSAVSYVRNSMCQTRTRLCRVSQSVYRYRSMVSLEKWTGMTHAEKLHIRRGSNTIRPGPEVKQGIDIAQESITQNEICKREVCG